jgi:protein-disulfide isomerase
MASRREQKDKARTARVAAEQAAAERAQRTRRFQMLAGAVVLAVAVVAVAIAISAGGGSTAPIQANSRAAKAAARHVDQLLAGIPQSGETLGKATAPVTVIEYGDLECSVCDMLAAPPSFTNPEGEQGTGWEDELINQYVREGEVKLRYRSLETASTSNPDTNAFTLQQEAADAAGIQNKAWYYIELFYNEQGAEGTGYVTNSFLEDIAKQIHSLNLTKWNADRNLPSIRNELNTDETAGTTVDGGMPSTPTLVVSGPDGTHTLSPGLPNSFSELQAAIRSVD